MPIPVELHDGRKLEFPDGTDPAVIQRTVKRMIAPKSPIETPEFEKEAAALVKSGGVGGERNWAEKMASGPFLKFASAAAAPMLGGAQLFAHAVDASPTGRILGSNLGGKVDEQLQAYKKMQNSEHNASDLGMELTGSALSPATLGYVNALRAPAGAIARTTQAGGAGATIAGAQPVTTPGNFEGQKLAQMAEGGTVGAVLGGGTEAIRPVANVVRDITRPWTQDGRTALAREFLAKQLGTALPATRAAIAAPQVGTAPTTVADRIAQANVGGTTRTGAPLAAMEEQLATQGGGISDAAKTIAAQQEAERALALSQIAKGPVERESVSRIRSLNAAKNFGDAMAEDIKLTPELARIGSDPLVKQVRKDIADIAQAKGITFKDQPMQYLDLVKKGIDAAVKPEAKTVINDLERAHLLEMQKSLLSEIEKQNSVYTGARKIYAENSVPGDQMDVARQLQKALTSSMGAERPAAFASAVQEAPRTIKRGTGENRYPGGFNQLFETDPEAAKKIATVQALLDRDAMKKSLGKGLDGREVLTIAEGGKSGPQFPAMFNRAATISNWVAKLLKHGADERIAREMGQTMLTNPEQFAQQYLTQPQAGPTRQALLELLQRGTLRAGGNAVNLGAQNAP
jgi:hypothetical protein